MDNPMGQLDHPSFKTAGATVAAYGIVLLVLFVLIFVVPYLVFSAI